MTDLVEKHARFVWGRFILGLAGHGDPVAPQEGVPAVRSVPRHLSGAPPRPPVLPAPHVARTPWPESWCPRGSGTAGGWPLERSSAVSASDPRCRT